MSDRPWQDESVLRELYHEEGLTQAEIAERLDCTNGTVSRWLNKHDIETNDPHDYDSGPWRDKELVNRLYHEEEMSAPEIAEKFGCSKHAVYERIENVRSTSEANRIWTWKLPLNLRTDKDGYEQFQTKVHGESMSFAHHRLIAVAEHGMEALEGKIVHHKSGIPWDNRPENLELMDQSDHVREHLEEIPQYEKTAMWALGEGSDYTAKDVAELFGHSRSTVTTVWKRINDGDYPITEVNA